MPMSVFPISITGPCSICASSQQAHPRGPGYSAPPMPFAASAWRTLMPWSSVVASAASSDRSPACTREPIIAGRKRLPSSLVQFTSSSGARVCRPASCKLRKTSSPASTPNTPSNRPPVGTVSRWLPNATGFAAGSVPGRRRNMLPMESCSYSSPSGPHHSSSKARAWASSPDSAWRLEPSPAIEPIRAMSICPCHRRSLSMIGVRMICSYCQPASAGRMVGGAIG